MDHDQDFAVANLDFGGGEVITGVVLDVKKNGVYVVFEPLVTPGVCSFWSALTYRGSAHVLCAVRRQGKINKIK